MLVSTVVTASAASQVDASPQLTATEQQFIEQNYEKHTVEISPQTDAASANSRTLIKASEYSYQQAVQYVNSLDLSAHPDVKEENLKYLEELKEAGVTIESYTVLVPRDDGLYTYGTRNGMTYFYKYYSTAVLEVMEDDTFGSNLLEQLVDGAVDFVVELCGGDAVAHAWSVIRLALGLPATYTVQSGDFLEYKVKVNTTLRGIYTQDLMLIYGHQPSVIVRVYTGEAGSARAYVVHHVPTMTGSPEFANWIGEPEYISTQDYYDKNAIMALAETLYYSGGDGHHYLTDVVIRNSDMYFQ